MSPVKLTPHGINYGFLLFVLNLSLSVLKGVGVVGNGPRIRTGGFRKQSVVQIVFDCDGNS